MLKNYFKIACRNLMRNKAFSAINIFGLAIGLATCLLIMLYIFNESGYDKHFSDVDRIFRVYSTDNKGETWAATSAPMASLVQHELPEVEQSTRLMTFPDIARMLISNAQGNGENKFFETNGYYVDSNFFRVLDFDFVYGDQRSALNEPNTIVISKDMSKKYFGSENPVGKPLKIKTPFGDFDYSVKGVFDNTRYKSHIPANYFLSMRNTDMWNWVQRQTSIIGNNVFFTYFKLKARTNPTIFEKKLQALYEQHAGPLMKAAGYHSILSIQPVKDIYLHSALQNEIAANGNITYLYILGSIGIFILLIACINFMNLSTARSEKRAKEVGVRKVLGAEKKSLIWQFLGESFLMCILSLVIALALVKIILPFFNNLTQKNIRFFDKPSLLLWIAGLTMLTGLLAGIYPAFYLSSFKPVSIIKGKIMNSFSATTVRKGLVVFQFTISICLILAVIVIYQQLKFVNNQQLGFNKEQKLILPLGMGYLNSEPSYLALRDELLKDPEIKEVSCGSAYPGVANLNDMLFYVDGKTTTDAEDVHLATIDNNYIQTMGFKVIAGRPFSAAFKGDSASIVINQTAVKALGYTLENAIGKKIHYDFNAMHGTLQIVGVLGDFNFESLHNTIKPFGFTTTNFADKYSYLIAAAATNDYAALIQKVEKIWKKTNPSIPFVYSFLDQDFQHNYEKEQRQSGIVVSFTGIAIFVACLGLFGLAAFSAEQRKKEIGVRKVLGASITDVTTLLSKEFLVLIVIAILIASPVSWWAMNSWLQNFAYKTQISWWMFVAAACLSVFIALATVSFHAIRAALANPVKSLRTE
jgi:putative ABC transport system permease protein